MAQIKSLDNKMMSCFKYHVTNDIYNFINNPASLNEESQAFLRKHGDDDKLLTVIGEAAANKYMNGYVSDNYYVALTGLLEEQIHDYINRLDMLHNCELTDSIDGIDEI